MSHVYFEFQSAREFRFVTCFYSGQKFVVRSGDRMKAFPGFNVFADKTFTETNERVLVDEFVTIQSVTILEISFCRK